MKLAFSLLLLTFSATPAHAQGGPLTVEGGLMFWTIVIFAALLFILWKFAWPQILGAVEAREQALEKQIAEAAQNREESARILEEQKKLLQDARSQAHSIVSEAGAQGERERALVLEKARQEQEELVARARRDLAAERDRAIADLRREAVDLSLAAAGRLIGQRLEGDADRKLVLDYLGSLESQN